MGKVSKHGRTDCLRNDPSRKEERRNTVGQRRSRKKTDKWTDCVCVLPRSFDTYPNTTPQLFTACCRRRLPDFPPRALSSTIQGLATLKYRPDAGFMEALVEAMDRELDNFTWLVGRRDVGMGLLPLLTGEERAAHTLISFTRSQRLSVHK